MDLATFNNLLDTELTQIDQLGLRTCITQHRVAPRLEEREWDYGEEGQTYPCWVGVEDTVSNTAIGYCTEGFGPAYPWGLLFIKGEYMSLGMDSSWFTSLEEAVRNSMFLDGQNPEGYEVS